MINNTETTIKDGGGGGTTNTPTGNGGTTFVCSECGRTCDCVNMSVENNICQKCYEEFYTPPINKFPDPEPDPDGGTTFVCSKCGRTCDCGNMSAEEGVCIYCYCSEPDDPPKPGEGGTTFVCSKCGHTCACGKMSIEPGVCIYCYRSTPDIDEEDEDTTFFCTECEQTYDLSMMSENPTMCKNCYAKSHTPPDDEENGGTTFVCRVCGKSCKCVNVSDYENVCCECYEKLPVCIFCGRRMLEEDRYHACEKCCNDCGSLLNFTKTGESKETVALDWLGTLSVDAVTSAVTAEFNEITVDGTLLPINLKHIYHSDFANKRYTAASNPLVADYSATDLGYGWRLNLMHSLVHTEDENVHVYTTGDGEMVLLTYAEADTANKLEAGYRNDELGLCCNGGMLEEGSLDDGTFKYFMFRNNGTYYVTAYYASRKTIINNCMKVDSSGRITDIEDGAGRKYEFAYSGEKLASITAPDGLVSTYGYTNGNLTSINRGGKQAAISYNASGRITEVCVGSGDNAHKVTLTYSGERVTELCEYYGSDLINKTCFNYDAALNSVTVTRVTVQYDCENTVTHTRYVFDENKNVVSTFNYVEDEFHTDFDFTAPTGDSVGVVKTANLLKNGSFEDGITHWTEHFGSGDVGSIATGYGAKFGKKFYKYQSDSSECTAALSQQVYLPDGDYTFSAYIRAVQTNAPESMQFYLAAYTSEGEWLGESEVVMLADDQHLRLEAPFRLNESRDVVCKILASGKATIYIDGASLEKSPRATQFNHLENGSFERGLEGWSVSGTAAVNTANKFSGAKSVCLGSAEGGSGRISQTVSVMGGDCTLESFTLSAWIKANIPVNTTGNSEDEARVYIGARLKYADGDSKEFITELPKDVRDWQNATLYIEKGQAKTLDGIEIFAAAEGVPEAVYVDSVSLVRDSVEFNVNVDYFTGDDSNGGTTFVCRRCGVTCSCGNMSPIEGVCFTCYNSNPSEDEEPDFSETKDGWGNDLTETTFADDSTLGAIYRSFTYTEDHNNVKTVRDERGYVTQYEVDIDSSKVTCETDPLGNKKRFGYDSYGRTTSVTHEKANGTQLASVSYTYNDFDDLTEIDRGDRGYTLEYNKFHQLDSIKADGMTAPLVSYGYTKGGRPKTVTYSNGDVMTAVYNAKGEIISELWKNADGEVVADYSYTYDTEGNIIRSIDFTRKKYYNYTYEDGVIIRATETSLTVNGEILRDIFPETTILYKYNGGKLESKRVIFHDKDNGVADTEQIYTYPDAESGENVSRITGDFGCYSSRIVTDGLGRVASESITAAHGVISRSFTYTEGDSSPVDPPLDPTVYEPTTQLVKTIELSDGTELNYEYDPLGRISSVSEKINGAEVTTSYTYDELGQLTSEKIGYSTITSMEYDAYGNITKKNGVTYHYDTVWKDRLIGVGDKTITYGSDALNPETYFGNVLVWEKGRQLKQFCESEYKYNANGIRTEKKENGVQHIYTLDGTKILREELIVGEIGGNSVIVPMYDANESVIGITYSSVAGTNTYYFLKNLQGDIVAITDDAGNVVARYRYDAWGKVLAVTDANGSGIDNTYHIAHINPYRYRGYYYDTETGLYYVSSRYYNPEIGRFLNSDDASYAINQLGSTEHNLYAYCSNDPVNSVDIGGFFTIKIYAIAAVTAAVIAAVAKVVGNYAKGYRGWKLFSGVLGASIGSAVNVVLLMKLIKWGKKGLLLAALAGAAVQSVFDFAEGVLIDKKYKWKQLTYDFILNFASALIGNYIGYKSIYINGYWFQPQNAVSFFTKSYGKRLIAQTGIGAVISLLIDLIRTGLEKLSKK